MTQERSDVYALTVRIDRDLAGRLKQIAHRQQKSMSEIVTGLIKYWVTDQETKWVNMK